MVMDFFIVLLALVRFMFLLINLIYDVLNNLMEKSISFLIAFSVFFFFMDGESFAMIFIKFSITPVRNETILDYFANIETPS